MNGNWPGSLTIVAWHVVFSFEGLGVKLENKLVRLLLVDNVGF